MSNLFRKLDEKDFFVAFVNDFFNHIPREINSIFECSVEIDIAKINYAYKRYQVNVTRFSELLYSEDPDHYKRSGAILQALHEADIIRHVNFVVPLDDIETGFSPIHMRYGDTVEDMPFARFFETYANEINCFIFAYNCCASYETNPKTYDWDFLNTVCVFLQGENSHSVEALYMIFKSFMFTDA